MYVDGETARNLELVRNRANVKSNQSLFGAFPSHPLLLPSPSSLSSFSKSTLGGTSVRVLTTFALISGQVR